LIKSKKYLLMALLLLAVACLSGCSLLQLPFMLVGETLKLVGKVFQVIDKLPKPPPGVF